MIQLFIKETDIAELTGFSGNIDSDSIKPAINVAQTTHFKAYFRAKFVSIKSVQK